MQKSKKIKITFVGNKSCGKSQLISTYTRKDENKNNNASPLHRAVLEKRRSAKNSKSMAETMGEHTINICRDSTPIELKLQDTPGDPSLSAIRRICYSNTDIFVYVFPVDKPDKLQNILDFVAEISNFEGGNLISSVLLGTHSDKRLANSFVIEEDEIDLMANRIGATETFECSAYNLRSVTDVIHKIVDLTLNNEKKILPLYCQEISTIKQKISYLPVLPINNEKNKTNRDQVLEELFSTEQRYLRSLYFIFYIYIEPLTESFNIPDLKVKEIFSTFPKIMALSERILVRLFSQFEKPAEEQSIGSSFLSLIERFGCYSIYCASQESGEASLYKLLDSNSKIKEFYRNAEKIKIAEDDYNINVKINEILILPFQRICRYSLLLQTLKNNTPNDWSDFQEISLAYEKLQRVLNTGNNAKGFMDNLNKLKDIYSNFIGAKPNLKATREFVLKGNARVTSSSVGDNKKKTVFLFSNLIVIAQNIVGKYRLNLEIPLQSILITDFQDTNRMKNAISLVPINEKNEKIYLTFSELEKKKKWFETMNKLIPEVDSNLLKPQNTPIKSVDISLRVSRDGKALKKIMNRSNEKIITSNIDNNIIDSNNNVENDNKNNNGDNNEVNNDNNNNKKENNENENDNNNGDNNLNIEENEEEEEEEVKKAIALFSYTPEAGDELGFTEGDILDVIVVDEEGLWHLCSRNGVEGYAPANYISLITPENFESINDKEKDFVIAVYDYDGQIKFSKGDVLNVLQKDIMWTLCSFNSRKGWVPNNHLLLIQH